MAKKINIAEQTPNIVNSIKTEKPQIKDTTNHLQGYIANSWNGGMLKPIAYKKVMAGERIRNYKHTGIIRMLTPKVPTAQKLKTTFKAYFVPNSRVWKNSEKFYSQKGSSSQVKIKSYPHIGDTSDYSNSIEFVEDMQAGEFTPITNTSTWRDSWVSSYIPRIAANTTGPTNDHIIRLPKINACLLRGFPAIYNDFERHKVFDEPMTEFNTDTVSQAEFNRYMPVISLDPNNLLELTDWHKRGRRQDSYYTNYRTSLEGFDSGTNLSSMDVQEHTEWQKLIAESRAQAENEQLNDWQIVAKLRGTRPVKDGKVRLLGIKTIGLNYQQVAQTTYNEAVTEENMQTLGATGAYSYTEYSVDLINFEEFIEDGFIHIIAQTSADTIFETGINREIINVNWNDEYRPDLKDLKDDVLYQIETGTSYMETERETVTGFKRKWSEYFKLPNIINGDMSSNDIYIVDNGLELPKIVTQNAFQFTEQSAEYEVLGNGQVISKEPWKDYTDIAINKNQAIMNKVDSYIVKNQDMTKVSGHNQIFMMAIAECITSQPIDNAIKNNFKTWGEE